MAQTVAEHIQEFLGMKEFESVVDEFGIKVLRHLAEKAQADQGRHVTQALQLVQELRAEQSRSITAEARTLRVIENMQSCIRALGERDGCRASTCSADFECYIEQRGQEYEPIFTLRCAKCRCRH